MGIVIVVLLVMNYMDRRAFSKERQILIDKIMSRDFTEYSNGDYLNKINKVPDIVDEDQLEILKAEEEYRKDVVFGLSVD